MNWNLDAILRKARDYSASDVHLVRGVAPALRVGGEIQLLRGESLREADLRAILDDLLNDPQRQVFDSTMQLCFSRHFEGVGRCRTSVYMHAGCPELALRLCEQTIRTRDELRLPPIVEELTRLPNGLILVTGPTGSGKTTTLNYMIDVINKQRRAKIVTIEDPVEFVHENQRSIVVQQEVYTDTPSFKQALVHVLRQDPDVIIVGEMRDLDTISTTLTAAETGHLVLATLHTPDAMQTVQRIYSVFPSEQQNNVKYQLSNSLQAVVAQNLMPRADGEGLVLASEILVATPAVRRHIRESETHMLLSEMQTGRKHQMQTMDNALLTLYMQGEITYDAAISSAREPDSIRRRSGAEPKKPQRQQP